MWSPFQTTVWSTIRLARDRKSTAVGDFVGRYRGPVLSFIRRQGFSEEDAEDLCQEVFLLILRDDLLARAEQSRGRFRNFLLGVARNVVRNALRIRTAAKRGGGETPVSLDSQVADASTLADLVASDTPDETFERDWIRRVVSLALEALERLAVRPHQVLKMRLEDRMSHAQIAAALELDAKQVDNLIQQARMKLSELLRAEVASYCGSREEYDDEIACLKRYLVPGRSRADRA